jgi:EAL domain-containing protein (putative c-di-GMP-specific phosphodiesterase class I)/DNA-binding response OmpR family regulator
MESKSKVLIADDDPAVLELLKTFVRPLEVEVITAADGESALQLAQSELPDVALLDVMMPLRSGWEVCQTLKGVQRTSQIRIILITGKGDVKDRLTGLQVGADDYLVKPFNREQVITRVGTAVRQSLADRAASEEVNDAAALHTWVYDRATSLPTVPAVIGAVRELLIQASQILIVHVDIEHYEAIEAEHGWAYFDEFLRTVGEVVVSEAKESFNDAIVSLSGVGGSSFYVFIDGRNVHGDEAIDTITQRFHDRLIATLSARFPKMERAQIGFFVGGSCTPYEPQIRIERQIYHGMRKAADAVRDAEQHQKRLQTREMREIIRRKRVTTLFQPIVWAAGSELFGYEILTRGPKLSSFQNSDMLFGLAREFHLSWALEALALESALTKLRTLDLGNKKFLINLEAEMFQMSEFRVHEMIAFLAEQRGHFVFELTERAAIEDYARFRGLLDDFRAKGIEIAIDDAGSGYASLEAIASLAPDYLKITKALVSAIATEPIKQDLVRLLVELAQKIGAKTIAEGIETAEEYSWCEDLGIDLLQGYYIARPGDGLVDEVLIRKTRAAR